MRFRFCLCAALVAGACGEPVGLLVVSPVGATNDALAGDVSVGGDSGSPQSAAVCAADCPKAVIGTAGIGENLIPQSVIKPVCADSLPSCGAQVANCRWMLKTPNGDKTAESSPAAAQSFSLDQTGSYQLCLQVADTTGKASCNEACLPLLVVPDNALHIELTWQTPADPNQFDSGPKAGADLDLHFAHPKAATLDLDCDGAGDPWFSGPFDTFWFHGSPKWSPTNDAKQDPTLDLDDTDGAGPENLNLLAPQGSIDQPANYRLGVHYWNDNGYGKSDAKIAVYVFGKLAYKAVQVLKHCDMWYVGKLNWPNTATGGGLPVVTPCFQAGLACQDGKDHMWVGAGDACVTPGYMNKKFADAIGGSACH